MRLKISHKSNGLVTLPLAYHHILQGIIYNAIKNTNQYSKLHDCAYQYDKRIFRAFTFSEISGKYRIFNKKITFLEDMTFYVSSPDIGFIEEVRKHIEIYGICYGDTQISDVTTETSDIEIEEERIKIKMISPVCVYTTNPQNKNTTFYNPGDYKFGQLIKDNFKRKYYAYYGESPDTEIEVRPVLVLPKHKQITRYKNIIHENWFGEYSLEGKADYLKFLYDTGIGAQNSKGFGMFEIIDMGN